MPQLDFANPLTFAQVVWMFLIFAVLYIALRTWALPLVGGVIEERQRRIDADLDAARLAKADSDRAVAEVVERSRAASAEAQAQIAAAMASAKGEADAQAQRDTAALERQLAEAEGRIRAARESAMGALREVATDAASTVVTRLTGQSPDSSRLDAAVGELIAARS